MEQKLNDVPWLKEKLIPEWGVGCRRLTPGIGYLETLSKPNVKVVFGEIESVTEKGCKCDDGIEYLVDVLICATGFVRFSTLVEYRRDYRS
jgi:cation diffusion facilitator CzcD-associated flavoprotein CzcO